MGLSGSQVCVCWHKIRFYQHSSDPFRWPQCVYGIHQQFRPRGDVLLLFPNIHQSKVQGQRLVEETHHSTANSNNRFSLLSTLGPKSKLCYLLPSDSIWSNIPPVVRAGVSTELRLPQVAAVCHSSAEPLHVCAVPRFLLQSVHQEEVTRQSRTGRRGAEGEKRWRWQ